MLTRRGAIQAIRQQVSAATQEFALNAIMTLYMHILPIDASVIPILGQP
ncbi:MAG TPA: hypothetical protein PK025_05240 [Spirochaetales bacterium]|nr:hypothetical protein [Spirochaetales bacterium]HPD80439.1 hypothetical protein [Spirochaetales bacterium]